mmetsp:Transcript_65144/g.103172  ORF Transcript_65144/g.103172 Transcript_65144/m.103172 type:complete len:308 (+) Transcript_65144:92-1015(+)|eukprot:CAMPEP_0169090322 /NCGR_PEP_ID=MMETSP1015-20121227/15755_1 /TAXON_ID=342587 /ORGANISM="Karlodinium micrum, Strain CCMP2283" /LENGTH=307 /DNA_ID=CAMNT_0009150715 /DNA_START=87 /DNA_END=1010 /DNA_ORIENTATION=+
MGLLCSKKQVNPAPCNDEHLTQAIHSSSKDANGSSSEKPIVTGVTESHATQVQVKTTAIIESQAQISVPSPLLVSEVTALPELGSGFAKPCGSDNIAMPNFVQTENEVAFQLAPVNPPAESQDTRIEGVRREEGMAEQVAPMTSPAETVERRVEGLSSSDEELEPERRSAEDQTPLLLEAVENDDWATVKTYLEGPGEYNPDARTTDWGYSLLRAAAEEGVVDVCRLLIARRADVNARDPNGMTPLMGCITGGDVGEIVTMLLEAKADATATTDDNFTALKWATRLNHEESISLLRAAGLQGETSCF